MTTPGQIRAARALLGLSQAEVASMTQRTTMTIRRAETEGGPVAAETIAAIRAALEAQGVVFLDNGTGPGVKLRQG